MADLKSPALVTPIGGQGLGGKVAHSNLGEVVLPTGAVASGDTMTVAHLPQNARVVRAIIKNETGSSQTFSLGVAGDTARYRASAALANGAAETIAIPAAALFARTVLYPTTPIVATFGAASTVASGGKFTIMFEYVVDEPVTAL